MLLAGKTAVIYGAGGAVGATIAKAFSREGASLYLAGRTLSKLEAVASEIGKAKATVEVTELDALDEQQIEDHLGRVLSSAGGIDICFNAIGIEAPLVAAKGMQGVPLTEIPLDSFMSPIRTYTTSHFLTGRAAARRMAASGRGGVILMHTPEPARIGVPLLGGMAPAWAAVEAICRSFSAEFAANGIRSVCLRSTGLPETETIQVIFGHLAKSFGVSPEQFRTMMEGSSHTRRSTRLSELADAAVFFASDRAAGFTGTVANLTGGKVSD
jgi:NAD(P)-dependent dehydrogenase (short-subunit alcohol dehydrogenase family)